MEVVDEAEKIAVVPAHHHEVLTSALAVASQRSLTAPPQPLSLATIALALGATAMFGAGVYVVKGPDSVRTAGGLACRGAHPRRRPPSSSRATCWSSRCP